MFLIGGHRLESNDRATCGWCRHFGDGDGCAHCGPVLLRRWMHGQPPHSSEHPHELQPVSGQRHASGSRHYDHPRTGAGV